MSNAKMAGTPTSTTAAVVMDGKVNVQDMTK
jgi:hypothetical protein